MREQASKDKVANITAGHRGATIQFTRAQQLLQWPTVAKKQTWI